MQAEQALLGALLLDPAQLPPLADWLEVRHFHRPAHAALYEVLLAQHAADHRALASEADPDARRAWALEAICAAEAASPGLTPSYAHALIAACPRAEHAPAYARMVLESAVHRALHEHAHRLLLAAQSSDMQDAVHLAEVLRQAIRQLTDAWGAVDPRPRRPLPQPPARRPDPAGDEALRGSEAMLLGALTDQPAAIVGIAQWLTGEDFLDPGHRAVYHALTALAHRGEPVDALTVLWEVQRRGALTSRTLTPDRIRGICAGTSAGDPGYWAETVLLASLLRQAATSAGIIRALALDPSLPATQLLGAATQALEPLAAIQHRWQTATGTQPPRPGPVLAGAPRTAAAHTPPQPAARPPQRPKASPRAGP